MRKNAVIAALLLGGVVLALVLLWSERNHVGSRVDRSPATESRPGPAPNLVAPADAGPDEAPTDGAAREVLAVEGAPIAGRVVVPGGIPAGEAVTVTATAYLGRENQGLVQLTVAPVASDGSFSLTVPRAARYALLDLESRFLYLTEEVKAEPGATGLVLEPDLAAILVGRVLAPLGTRIPDGQVSWRDVVVSCTCKSSDPVAEPDGVVAGDVDRVKEDGTFAIAFVRTGIALELRVKSPLGPPARERIEPLAPGEKRSVVIALEAGSVIAGRVIDETGAPVERASVSTLDAGADGEDEPRSGSRPAVAARADADGRFAFIVARQSWKISAHAEDLARDAEALVDASTGDVRDLVLEVTRGGCIAGTVRWPDGRLAQSFFVSATGPDGDGWQQGHAGHFRVCRLAAGRYEVTASAEEGGFGGEAPAVSASAGDTGIELVLVQRAVYSVHGTVMDEHGAPIDAAQVSAEGPDHRVGSTSVQSGGSFSVHGLDAGETVLRVSARGHAPAEQVVQVGPRSPGALVFVLAPSARVRGQVLDARGEPLAGATIWSDPPDEQEVSDAGGGFTLDVLPPSATLFARAKGYAPSEPLSVAVAAGVTLDGVVLRLRETCRLAGSVLDENGRPLAGVPVSIDAPRSWRQAETDARGHFELEDLPPGTFQVMAFRGDAQDRSRTSQSPSRPVS